MPTRRQRGAPGGAPCEKGRLSCPMPCRPTRNQPTWNKLAALPDLRPRPTVPAKTTNRAPTHRRGLRPYRSLREQAAAGGGGLGVVGTGIVRAVRPPVQVSTSSGRRALVAPAPTALARAAPLQAVSTRLAMPLRAAASRRSMGRARRRRRRGPRLATADRHPRCVRPPPTAMPSHQRVTVLPAAGAGAVAPVRAAPSAAASPDRPASRVDPASPASRSRRYWSTPLPRSIPRSSTGGGDGNAKGGRSAATSWWCTPSPGPLRSPSSKAGR